MAELDDFLGEPEDLGALPTDLATAAPADPAPEPEAEKPASEPKPGVKPAEPDHDDKPVPEDVAGLRSALQAERGKRNDYKGERDRLAGEQAALKAELEVLRKAAANPPAPPPAPVAPAPPVAIPNPIEDPDGWNAHQARQRFSDKLDISEDRLREQIGDDADVDAKIAAFKALAAANPALGAELQKQRHPYRFAYDYVKKAQAMEEIGDPAAWRAAERAKVEAEVRATVEAEYASAGYAQGGRAAPRVNLPQSLGTARSAAPRSSPVINIAESFDDILASARK